jgi:hypothetical protein
VLAGSQAIDAMVGAIAAVDRCSKRAYLYSIALPFAAADAVTTEETRIRRLGFDPEVFIGASQSAPLDFIGVSGGPP